ncbi:hypothetical protein FB45DRAFT_824678, partial [Roridomyces roridus]
MSSARSSFELSEDKPRVDASEEAAASKLWAVYVSEAEKYDKALVEGWKSDMEGMLIFAGLFSASLTAFIIESYKTLIPDSGDSTVQLLAQISRQLSAAADGSTLPAAFTATPFTPPITSLVCNALWFVSLGLSLTCALMATLLEQWARDFLHRAEMRSAPIIRARIYSYLYYGLKRFKMHAVVEIIPLLLHASLFFFFAGLVAFLLPISIPITVVVAAILAALCAAYSLLTVLPMLYLDCPYQTPLSGTLWSWFQWQRRRPPASSATESTTRHESSAPQTIVEATSRQAIDVLPERFYRDYRALVWTVKSLADDAELEPFVEAIPDLLWGPDSPRHAYDSQIRNLIHHPDLKLLSRIESLLRSCDSGLLLPESSKRRQITCYKALWAILSLPSGPAPFESNAPAVMVGLLDHINLSGLRDYVEMEFIFSNTNARVEEKHYMASVEALVRWQILQQDDADLNLLLNHLSLSPEGDQHVDLTPMLAFVRSQEEWFASDGYDPMLTGLPTSCPPHSPLLPVCIEAVNKFRLNNISPHRIIFDYLSKSPAVGVPPYRYNDTRSIIQIDGSPPFSVLQEDLEWAMYNVITRNIHRLEDTKAYDWVDSCMEELCYWWAPDEPAPLPSALIYYLNHRDAAGFLNQLFASSGRIHRNLWAAFSKTLAEGPSLPSTIFQKHKELMLHTDDVLTALWRVASLREVSSTPALYEALLPLIQESDGSPFIKFSVAALVKQQCLDALAYEVPPRTSHWLLPEETSTASAPAESAELNWKQRIDEAKFALLAEFLEQFDTEVLPYKMAETISGLGAILPRAPVHESHQLRLADGVQRLSNREQLSAVLNAQVFDLYAGKSHVALRPGTRPVAWLDNRDARKKMKDVLAAYIDQGQSGSDAALL